MEKLGINNLKLLLGLPIKLGMIGHEIGKENTSNWKKWLKLVDILPETIDILKIDWKMIKQEYLDLDAVERAEINQFMIDKFDIDNDRIELIIEKSFSLIFAMETIIREAIDLFKGIKIE